MIRKGRKGDNIDEIFQKSADSPQKCEVKKGVKKTPKKAKPVLASMPSMSPSPTRTKPPSPPSSVDNDNWSRGDNDDEESQFTYKNICVPSVCRSMLVSLEEEENLRKKKEIWKKVSKNNSTTIEEGKNRSQLEPTDIELSCTDNDDSSPKSQITQNSVVMQSSDAKEMLGGANHQVNESVSEAPHISNLFSLTWIKISIILHVLMNLYRIP